MMQFKPKYRSNYDVCRTYLQQTMIHLNPNAANYNAFKTILCTFSKEFFPSGNFPRVFS